MRIAHHHFFTVAAAALFCGLAVGQEQSSNAPSQIVQTELRAGDVRASNLLGAMVKRLTGDSIGEVEDLIVSADGDVRLAVISVGGVLGLGSKIIAIPFEEFTVAPDGATLFLTMSEDELESRPAFDLEGVKDVRSSAGEPAAPSHEASPEANNFAPVSPDPVADTSASAQGRAAHALPEQGDRVTSKSKASKQPASTLIGARVVDTERALIGKINDLIVTAEPPEVQVIVALDDGIRLVAVPLSELAITTNDAAIDPHLRIDSVETSLTVAQLDALPQFHYE